VRDEYGPGQIHGRRQKTKNTRMSPSAQEERASHGLKSTPKITPKIKISDPNKNTKNTPNSDFSKKIQHGSYTAEVSALPPSF
jgi:hypothetical protein